jgi:hypothetical protein
MRQAAQWPTRCVPTLSAAVPMQRLLSEMQGLLRAKQVHTPNCACTVCKQRRKLQAKLAAAGAAGSTQQPPPAPAKAHVRRGCVVVWAQPNTSACVLHTCLAVCTDNTCVVACGL